MNYELLWAAAGQRCRHAPDAAWRAHRLLGAANDAGVEFGAPRAARPPRAPA